VRYLAVALLFAICGALTARYLLTSGWWVFPRQIRTTPAVPFALLCAILCLRTWRIVFAVPLMVGVWYVSARAGDFVGTVFAPHFPILPGCVGGFIGGVGLVLSAATCYGQRISPKHVFRGAVVGVISALPFAFWTAVYTSNVMSPHDVEARPLLVPAFAIWQAGVGTYLYAICTDANRRAPPDAPAAWKQYLVLNSVAALGFICSFFVVPQSTPIRVWAAISGCAIALMNVALYRHLSRPKSFV
jgi:hypothetical protein